MRVVRCVLLTHSAIWLATLRTVTKKSAVSCLVLLVLLISNDATRIVWRCQASCPTARRVEAGDSRLARNRHATLSFAPPVSPAMRAALLLVVALCAAGDSEHASLLSAEEECECCAAKMTEI